MSVISRIVRGRKAAFASSPSDWRQWPEWQRVSDQVDSIQAQADVAASDHVAAQAALAALRADRDRADVAALLGDAPGQAAEALGALIPSAEKAWRTRRDAWSVSAPPAARWRCARSDYAGS